MAETGELERAIEDSRDRLQTKLDLKGVDPIVDWDSVLTTMGKAIYPVRFQERLDCGVSMDDLVQYAVNMVYRESVLRWEMERGDIERNPLKKRDWPQTAFDKDRSRITEQIVDEEAGLAAFKLVTYDRPYSRKRIEKLQALYGLRRVNGHLKGALIEIARPFSHEGIMLEGGQIRNPILEYTRKTGKKKERAGYDLSDI